MRFNVRRECPWARLPRLQAALPAERTSVAVWGAIFFLSIITFVVAAY